MPKTATDYSKNVIYKIQHNDDDSLLYVGHTTNFIKRKALHKYNCEKHSSPVYKMMRDNGGWECFTMIVIKEYPCVNKMEACIEEDKIMREMKASMNNYRAYKSLEERKEHEKEYRVSNREVINEKQKERYQGNKQTYQDYYQANKKYILERKKIYVEANKELISEKLKEKVQCVCGCIVSRNGSARHKKSKKHLESLNC
jgi:hypothetical protein